MINLETGSKIRSLTKNSTHVIESVETVEGKTVVFTEDVKCFPIEDVTQHYDSFVSEYFIKVFSGETPTDEEEEKLKKIFQNMNVVTLKKTREKYQPNWGKEVPQSVIPKPQMKKPLLFRIWDKIKFVFLQ